jgi:hypothetical protein
MAYSRRKSRRSSKSRKSRSRGKSKARRSSRKSYSRKGTRGRRGGRWTEQRARKKARFYQRRHRKSGPVYVDSLGLSGRRGRRSNPGASQLRDGTLVSISGDSVTLHSNMGESYEYHEVSRSGLSGLFRAKNISAAKKLLNQHGIMAAVNPRRNRGRTSKAGRRQSRRYRGRYVRHHQKSRSKRRYVSKSRR